MSFNIITLGCKVNSYESSVMKDILIDHGYTISDDDKADIVIINTCSVTNTADSKSLKLIRRAVKHNPDSIIVVTGCLSQNKTQDVCNIEGVSIVLGNINKTKIIDYINEYKQNGKQIIDVKNILDKNIKFENMKLNNFDHTRAFVKIQEGCNNFCTYCIIPYTRGGVRSKDRESVLIEVCDLVKEGHKEIVLTGIHTGHYGSEFKDYKFENLLEDLITIDGLERIRISSIEMNEITDNIINLMKNNKVLVDHMHIPLQSGSDYILKKMNRKYDKSEFIKKIEDIRKVRPNISITTDVIVGFPGETDELFNETIETIKKIKFSKLHVFPYSVRNGTPAAKFDNQISNEIKKKRVHKLLEISKELELEYMNKFISKEVDVLVETIKDGILKGHTGNYLCVKFKGDKSLINKVVRVRIDEIDYPYCRGVII